MTYYDKLSAMDATPTTPPELSISSSVKDEEMPIFCDACGDMPYGILLHPRRATIRKGQEKDNPKLATCERRIETPGMKLWQPVCEQCLRDGLYSLKNCSPGIGEQCTGLKNVVSQNKIVPIISSLRSLMANSIPRRLNMNEPVPEAEINSFKTLFEQVITKLDVAIKNTTDNGTIPHYAISVRNDWPVTFIMEQLTKK
jgi:hypothetical protein